MPVQTGVELNFGEAVSLALLGEARAGLGFPYFLEANVGGMAELYFWKKKIGIGAGYGSSGLLWPIFISETPNEEPPAKATYFRLAFILRDTGSRKTSFYATVYANGDWGFGIMYNWPLFNLFD